MLNTILKESKSRDQFEEQEEQFQPIATFILKTYAILNEPENASVIAWQTEGNCFIIKNITSLVQKVLPLHFRHHKYESFIRQLNMYNFSKIKAAEGPCFANPYFQREREDLLRFIKRKPQKKKKKTVDQQNQKDKENSIKMISEENCQPLKKDGLMVEEEPVPLLKQQEPKVVEKVKKVHFSESLAEIGQEHLSTMIQPSCKWLTNKEQSVLQNIKSFKSFKVSLKLLGLDGEQQDEKEQDPMSSNLKSTEIGIRTLKHLESN